MDPSGDAADGTGTCDVAIDNKNIDDDDAMDVTGDDAVGVDRNELTNGDKDESDIGIDVKDSGDFRADSGFAQFTALNDEKDDNLNDETEMNDDNEDETNDANDGSEADAETAMDQDEAGESGGQLEDNALADSAERGVFEEANYQSPVLSQEEQDEVENDNGVNVDDGEGEDDAVIDHAESGVSEEADDIVDSVTDETADHDETIASFVTAADESFPVNPSELSDQTIGANVSQEESDERLLDDTSNSGTEGHLQPEAAEDDNREGQEQFTEDVAKSPEEASEEEDTVSKEESGWKEMVEEPVEAPLEPSEDDDNIAEDKDAQQDGSVQKEENDTMDEFVENLLGTPVTGETAQENDSLVPEEEPPSTDGIGTEDDLVEGFPGIIDVRGSVDTDTVLAEHDNDDIEPVSHAKGFDENLTEDFGTQDSVTEASDKSKDDLTSNKEASEMSQMQALYGESSEESNNAEGSGEFDAVSREVPDKNESGKDTDEVFSDSDKLENNEDSVLDSDNANIEDKKNESDNDDFNIEYEMKTDTHNLEDSTSENITSDVHEESGETAYVTEVTDAGTEQMEVDDAEESKMTENTEKGDENIDLENKDSSSLGEESSTKYDDQTGTAISDEQVSTDRTSENISPSSESNLTKANDNEDSGEMVSESLKDTSQEMTEADEAKLLEPTEEEQKADEGEEAMETDKTDDKEADSEQVKTDKEANKDTSADQKSPGEATEIKDETEKAAETADKTSEDMEVTMETSEKTVNGAEKSDDGEKAIEENDKTVKKSSAEKAVAQDDKTTEDSAEPAEDKKVELDKKDEEILEKKVKKEKLEEGEEGPDIKTDDSSTGPKIVGVTSAVGMEDIKPKSSERKKSTDEKKKSSRNASPVVIDDEEEKATAKDVKEETKPGRTTRSASAAGVKKEQDKKAKSVKQETDDKDDDVIAIKEEKKPAPKPKSSSKIQKCIVCLKVGKCKYNIVRNGDVKHLCDDVCFKKFRSNPTEYLRQATPAGTGTQPKAAENKTSTPATPAANQNQQKQTQGAPPPVYKTCSVCQLMNVRTSKPFLNWQGLDFCGEECLGKFQGSLSATCSFCASQINQANRAKFCWRVGTEVKQFCSSPCYSEFIKRLKLCAFCNKDLANIRDSFMAPVGNQGTFKDFCSQVCLANYEERNSKDIQIVGVERGQKTSMPPKGNFQCQVCGKTGPVKHEIKLDGKQNRLCSDPCLSAFQYANKLTMNTCDNCGTNCYNENTAPQYIQFEGQQKRFCSYMCVNSFKSFNKKTVPCAWCAAKKSNFDMIERVDANNKYQLFCSLNCLSLYRVNLQATSNQAVVCDQCRKFVPAQYHLTMSDASVRNFCSYTCVMQFQAQFTTPKSQQTNNTPPQPQARTAQQQLQTGLTTRSKATYNTRGTNQQPPKPQPTVTPPQQPKQTARQLAAAQKKQTNASGQSIPIISNVVSLAPQGNQQQINVKSSTPVVVQGQQEGIKTTTTTTGNQTVQQQIIIQPPPPKTVKNKSLLCKPYVQTKATSCKPHTQTKEVQTEGKAEPDRYFIPVPVPVYVPTPLAMYTTPTPVMVPVPVPVPVPVFIPTTKKSAGSILKQIKEIQERIPNDPLEAELLIMAEAVAGKDEESSSESEDELPEALPVVSVPKEPVVAPNSQELGEDMLQMALRMASEMSDEPVMDLENSLEPVAVSSVPPPVPQLAPSTPAMEEEDDDTDEYIPPSSRSTRRTQGRKRSSSARKGRSSKRQKVEVPQETLQREATESPQPPAPPPDANFHLKYTYGVNAWKHWVIAKNAQLESASKTGSNKKLKPFKADLLQCTADELNFALCLFVKEVRKPNGEEYAVDSIYYLCLGIQQYLFENGRIDNIFTDTYFDKFTEFLNEVLTMYEPKLNTAGQLVCRIEEEHLWESKQLGAHSPHVLLNSLVYFNTKFFMLKTSEDHLKLSFTHIMKHWKKTASGKGSGTGANVGRSVYLRYYCPNLQADPNQKKKKEEMPVYEQTENLENPLRCPVKLYEFYLSKCPESIKNRNDTFYLVPERSCVPDSPVWYSTMTLGVDSMAKMLNRIRLVREIQEAHLHTQPVYI